MKKILLIATLLLAFSCNNPETAVVKETAKKEQTIEVDMHNSKISLDWAGTYKGTTPCADCAGIELTLNLTDDETFSLKEVYLTDETNEFISEGKFSWDENGSKITLEKDNGSIIFKVGENHLLKLDVEGNEIKGNLADKYILKKL